MTTRSERRESSKKEDDKGKRKKDRKDKEKEEEKVSSSDEYLIREGVTRITEQFDQLVMDFSRGALNDESCTTAKAATTLTEAESKLEKNLTQFQNIYWNQAHECETRWSQRGTRQPQTTAFFDEAISYSLEASRCG